jgi:hypothetical protein
MDGRLNFRSHEELPLDHLPRFPALDALHAYWTRLIDAAGGVLPAKVDPLQIDPVLLPYLMLLDIEPDGRLRVRLAGTMVCNKHGGEMRGKTTDDFFRPADAAAVVAAGHHVAETGRPSLARRSYVGIDNKLWSYVRLMLPISRSGTDVDGLVKTLEPATLNY